MRSWKKVINVVLVLIIISTIGVIVYIAVNPNKGETFTEFYILNEDGQASNYPEELNVGEATSIILGIVNHERQNMTYHIEIEIEGTAVKQISDIELDHQEQWEQSVAFTPN